MSDLLAVDIDNVITATDPHVRTHIAAIGGISLLQADVVAFDYAACGVPQEVVDAALDAFHDSCASVDLLPGCESALDLLAQLFRIGLVTSRPARTETLTREWLKRTELPFSELVFATNKTAYASNAIALLEDSLSTAVAVSRAGTPTVLFDYPWNRASADVGLPIYRVDGWSNAVVEVHRLNSSR